MTFHLMWLVYLLIYEVIVGIVAWVFVKYNEGLEALAGSVAVFMYAQYLVIAVVLIILVVHSLHINFVW